MSYDPGGIVRLQNVRRAVDSKEFTKNITMCAQVMLRPTLPTADMSSTRASFLPASWNFCRMRCRCFMVWWPLSNSTLMPADRRTYDATNPLATVADKHKGECPTFSMTSLFDGNAEYTMILSGGPFLYSVYRKSSTSTSRLDSGHGGYLLRSVSRPRAFRRGRALSPCR